MRPDEAGPPREPYGALFLRFLRFGLLAWGGPVAQIAMIRQEMVEEARWVSRERFNRVLAVYQVLPGPEATELCVYFGYVARGRLGGLLAGLGFVLPGFVLMFALSVFYVTYGLATPALAAVFYGFQAAVVALIVRAIHRIGEHAVTDRWLLGIAVAAGVAQLLGAHFLLTLALAALVNVLVRRGWHAAAIGVGVAFLAGLAIVSLGGTEAGPLAAMPAASRGASGVPSLFTLLGSGLRSGLLTFGGAYTVIPFLQHDAVVAGGWMTNEQFLDGLALSGILPAPLIIFATFVGYLGGGPLGALALTVGIFAPAFAFTLVGYDYVERLVENRTTHVFLDGVTAGVVGLIAATTAGLFRAAVTDVPALGIFGSSLLVLYRWKAKTAIAFVVLGAGLLGLLRFQV